MKSISPLVKRTRPVLSIALLAAAVMVLSALLSGCSGGGCGTRGDSGVPIGGAFELTDTNGQRVSESAFRGKYLLIYFGFTYCPDVCPVDLQKMTQALDMAGGDADKVQPVFVTIDPGRDNPETVATYMQHFHPDFIGLTGTDEEIAAAAGAYRVYYAKVPNEDFPDAYLMNHSSNIYLMDCDGAFIQHFSQGTPVDDIAAAIKALK